MPQHKWKELKSSPYKGECIVYSKYPEIGAVATVTEEKNGIFMLSIKDRKGNEVHLASCTSKNGAEEGFNHYMVKNWKENSKKLEDSFVENLKTLEAAFTKSKAFKKAPTTGEVSRFGNEVSWRIRKDGYYGKDRIGSLSLTVYFEAFRFTAMISIRWFRETENDFGSSGSDVYTIRLIETASDPVKEMIEALENWEKLPDEKMESIAW